MTLQWVLGWWNLIYLAPFAIALTYLAIYITTGIGFDDADHEFDADVDHDLDHDTDGDADHDADHDTYHDAEHDADEERVSAFSLLPLLGLGRVPTTLLVLIASIVWGISGFATNQVLHKTIADGDVVGLWSLPIAGVITLVLTAVLARTLAKAMPMKEPPATSLAQLVGETGVAILPINATFGLAKVAGHSGASVQVPCRLAPGQDVVNTNEPVQLLWFDRNDRVFYVTTPQRLAAMREGRVEP